ncbi:MAG: endonuclease/exonuclease/phosphatase family protein, partial [Flavobacteriales bacterium]|nr:endonuclease/exonuclease/phosphatase family protein [Flavobacteriales bacterium]
GLTIIAGILPMVPHPHWIFRGFEFGKFQFSALGIVLLAIGFSWNGDPIVTALQISLGILLIRDGLILIKYSPLYPLKKAEPTTTGDSPIIRVLSANVLQFNTEYHRLINMIKSSAPDIVVTLESNSAWEEKLTEIEVDFPHSVKIPLENTYGMHLYSKLEITEAQKHFFVADDLPSIQAQIQTSDGRSFTLFAVHPPPPSPSEEPTSEERDGDLLCIAKALRKIDGPRVVVGDFNNVAWGRSSVLFRKTSELIDARIGRGFISTFHARFLLLRVPIDLFFHSEDVIVADLKAMPNIGSDHFPLLAEFRLTDNTSAQEEEIQTLEADELEEVNSMIRDGKKAEGDREDFDS